VLTWWRACACICGQVSNADDMYISGRILGGGSSINGQQVVRPSVGLLERLYVASGKDPNWAPDCLVKIMQVCGPSLSGSSRGDACRLAGL
jgi:choline dehydrogenase-like flavoprotein